MKRRYTHILNLPVEDRLKRLQSIITDRDTGPILGVSHIATQVEVWHQKIQSIPVETPTPEFLEGLHFLGDGIARWWMKQTGMMARKDHKLYFHPELNYIGGVVDRVITAVDDRGPGILQVALPSLDEIPEWETSPVGMPLYIYCQVQHQLECTGYLWGEVAAPVGGHHFKRVKFTRNDPFIQTAMTVYQDFWFNYVLPKIPPSSNGKESVNPGAATALLSESMEVKRAVSNLIDQTPGVS